MGEFNRGIKRVGRGGGFRSGFGDRGGDRPQMHKAVCDNCGKECQVPFRPTSGKPIYCSDCFQDKRGSEPRRFERRDSRPPRFEAKSENYKEQFEALNNKLDKILKMLAPAPQVAPVAQEEKMVGEAPKKKTKVSKKTSSADLEPVTTE